MVNVRKDLGTIKLGQKIAYVIYSIKIIKDYVIVNNNVYLYSKGYIGAHVIKKCESHLSSTGELGYYLSSNGRLFWNQDIATIVEVVGTVREIFLFENYVKEIFMGEDYFDPNDAFMVIHRGKELLKIDIDKQFLNIDPDGNNSR